MGFLKDFSQALAGTNDTISSTLVLLVLFLLTAVVILSKSSHPSKFPIVNKYPGDVHRTKAREAFVSDANGLLEYGLRNYPGQPFEIITTLSSQVILPHEWMDWLKRHPDLDHQAIVAQDFFGHYPGFEAFGAFNDPNQAVINLIKKKMSQTTAPMLRSWSKHADDFLNRGFRHDRDWHQIEWGKICPDMIAAVSSSIFSGSRLARNSKWQTLITTHTMNVFNAARRLRACSPYLRPIAHWWITECRRCRSDVAQARNFISNVPKDEIEPGTALDWTLDSRHPDAAVIQLALAAGAIHTSSQLLQQVTLDLALASTQPTTHTINLIADLRSEIATALLKSSGTLLPSTLAELKLLDATIKESQRLKPQTLVNLERVPIRKVTLPNGVTIPAGTQVGISSRPMWNVSNFGPDVADYNPYRWVAAPSAAATAITTADIDTEEANRPFKQEMCVSSSSRHFAFGAGRFICPGRFFVIAEIKVILVKILLGWDLRLAARNKEEEAAWRSGKVPHKCFGYEQLADNEVRVQVRKREAPDGVFVNGIE